MARGRGYRTPGNLRRKAWWPFLMLALFLLLGAGLVMLAVKVIIPFIGRLLEPGISDNVLPVQSAVPVQDLSDKTREVLLAGGNRSIGDPVILGDDIFFPGGRDADGNTLNGIVVHNTTDRSTKQIIGIRSKHDGILSIDVNADYIVYFDSKNSGGGNIYAYDRNSGKIKELMRISYGWPQVHVAGKYAIWMERTGNAMDKLYLMEIETLELTTLAVFEDSPFGLSQPGVSKSEVVWADADPERTEDNGVGVLKILPLDGSAKEAETYFPEMYIYCPVTNGNARAWLDSDLGDGAGLYLSIDGTRPKKVAEGVENYGLGENFIAYTRGGVVWVYFFSTDTFARISPVGEYCYLGDVGDHGVAWFDITDPIREQDILKYAILD